MLGGEAPGRYGIASTRLPAKEKAASAAREGPEQTPPCQPEPASHHEQPLYGVCFVKNSILAPLLFFFVFRGADGVDATKRRSLSTWQAAANHTHPDAQDFVTIKGGTRHRARRLPRYNLVFGSPLRDPP